jgi:hypothetical protein
MPTRYFFEPPRRQKAGSQLRIKKLLVRCPSSSRLIDTGQTIEEDRWATAKVKTQKFTCRHCGSVHVWKKEDVVLGRPT